MTISIRSVAKSFGRFPALNHVSLEIADDAYVLDDGIVVYSGTAKELAADEGRVRALAGASAEEWTLT